MTCEQEERYQAGYYAGRCNPSAPLSLDEEEGFDLPYVQGVVSGKLSRGWDRGKG